MITDDQLTEWIEADLRAVELAERLTAPGPKASAVSASELHEVAEFVLDAARTMQSLIAEIRQSRRESVELLTGIEQSLKENNTVLTYAHANDAALERAYENLRVDLQRLLDRGARGARRHNSFQRGSMSHAYPVSAQARAFDRADDRVEGKRRSAGHPQAKRAAVVVAGQLLVTILGVNRIGMV